MDPLSVTTSIAAVVGVTTVIIQYLNEVKGSLNKNRMLAFKAAKLLVLLTDLKNREEEAELNRDDPWYSGIRELGGESGPLELFKRSLDVLASKLKPSSSKITAAGRILLWEIDKSDVKSVLAKIGRLRSLIGHALAKDLL